MQALPTPEARPAYLQRATCRLCDGHDWSNVLSLGDQFLPGYVKLVDPLLPKAPLELILCNGCGLLQLKHSVNPDLMWKEYWYRSSVNQTMRDALTEVVDTAHPYHSSGTWLDIGANDGFLLSRVPDKFRKIAVEPALNLQAELQEHADLVINDFFPAQVDEKADVITSCAMFYDLEDPNAFTKGISDTLKSDGVWINQLSYTPRMLKDNAFDGICHEHRCYYDIPTLHKVYRQNGLKIVDVSFNEVNGGSVRLVAKKGIADMPVYAPMSREEIFGFSARIKKWRNLMRWVLDALELSGRSVYGYGASTKGSCLLQYLDHHKTIVAVAERNPHKVGLKMTGTWLPIISEEEMRAQSPDVLLCLPYSFKEEMTEREAPLRKGGTCMLWPLPEVTISI